MRFPAVGLWLVAPALASSFGCASMTGVRYVYQDGDYGVVGLPENSDSWPHFYRTRAEKLMAEHFPDGHEVVRAEEVAEGSRVFKLEGSHTAEVSPAFASVGVNVGKFGGSTTRSQADTTTITESRIIYRRAGGETIPGRYAEAPELTPKLYLDPNAAERRKAAEPTTKGKPADAAPPPAAGPPQPAPAPVPAPSPQATG